MKYHWTERRKELVTGWTIIVLFGFSFVVGEIALRTIQWLKFGTETTVEKSSLFHVDSETGLRLPKPNAVQGRIKINEHGFRSPSISADKPPRTVRLAFLGSSTTYNAQASNETTWPHLTWHYLQERFPDCTFDYLNAGFPGLDTRDQQHYYARRISRFEPDIVLILTNDFNSDSRRVAKEQGLFDGRHYEPSWLARHSVLWGKIEKNIVIIRRQRSTARHNGKLDTNPHEFSGRFAQRLDALVKSIRAGGALVVLLELGGQLRENQSEKEKIRAANTALFYMPYMSVDGLLNGRKEYNRVIRQVAQDNDAIAINGFEEIPGNTLYFADSEHFRPRGSQLMAEAIVSNLTRTREVLELVENSCR